MDVGYENEGLKSAADALKNVQKLNSELKNTKALLNDSISPFESLNEIAKQLFFHKTGENKLTSKELKNLADKVKAEQDNLFVAHQALKVKQDSLKNDQQDLQNKLKTRKLNKEEYKAAKKGLKSIGEEVTDSITKTDNKSAKSA